MEASPSGPAAAPLPASSDVRASLAVAAAAVAATGLSVFDSFTYWDDHVYVLENPLVTRPSLAALGRILAEPFYANYQPLHLLSYWIDRALWNLHPAGMHALNVLLYAAGCFLLHRVARRLPLPAPVALLGLLLYAVHPTHVEAVAWISARKDCLMLPLLAGACLLWLRGGARARSGALALGTAAALAKSQAMVLPGLLVALEVLRVGAGPGAARARLRAALPALLPFVAVSLLVALAAIAAQSDSNALKMIPGGPLGHAGTVVRALVFSLRLAFLPAPLSAVYDLRPALTLGAAELAGLAGLAALVAAAVWAWRRHAAALPAFALLWTAAALAPVSGIVPLAALAADRYLLLPTFGLMLAASAALQALAATAAHNSTARGRPLSSARLFHAAAALLLIAGEGASGARTLVWRDDLTLWRDTATRAPGSVVAAANLGAALADAGDMPGAAAALARAEALRPGDPTIFANRLRVAVRLERPGVAGSAEAAALETTLRTGRDDPVALCALAAQWSARGAPSAAAITEERAHRLGAPADCYHTSKVAVPAPPPAAPPPASGGSP